MSEQPTPYDDEITARELARHENEVTNHRMEWFGTINGFLFAALGFAWGSPNGARLVAVLSVAGALVSFFTICTLTASTRAMSNLSKFPVARRPDGRRAPGIVGIDPDPGFRWIGSILAIWTLIPVTFLVVWIWLFFNGPLAHSKLSPPSIQHSTVSENGG
jgi:hypothetical protein